MFIFPSQSDDKTAVMDSPVLGHENGAGTEVSDQYSIPDSVEPTILGECVYL